MCNIVNDIDQECSGTDDIVNKVDLKRIQNSFFDAEFAGVQISRQQRKNNAAKNEVCPV